MDNINNIPPEVRVSPLGDMMLNFLIERDKEEPFLDFKETLDVSKGSHFANIAKDIFAFSNYGGGFLLIGFKERPKENEQNEESQEKPRKKMRAFLKTGLPNSFHIDSANLQTKFESYSNCPIELDYHEFYRIENGENRKFAAIYIPPSTCVLKPIKKGKYRYQSGKRKGKEKIVFEPGTIFFRRGTRSIIASEKEVEWIEQRAEKEGYKLSVLSGQPDIVYEKLFSNLFKVLELPEKIFSAYPREQFYENLEFRLIPRNSVFLFWKKCIYTFEDLTNPENFLSNLVHKESIVVEKTKDWLEDKDKKRILIQLLNKEFSFLSVSLKLRQEIKKKHNRTIRTHTFYFPCYEENRFETWKPRYKEISKRLVAQRIWAKQLNQFVFWHSALKAQFFSLDNQLFLRLNPSVIVTDDGLHPIPGGTVVTRLIYNRYNISYLNSLLFWVYYLSNGDDKIFLSNKQIKISGKPSTAELNFGIVFDRPSREIISKVPEVNLVR